MRIEVIYGAPCSGKTTWARSRMTDDDVIYDYDAITRAISNKAQHNVEKHAAHDLVMALRDRFVDRVKDRAGGTAYILTMRPSESLRNALPETAIYTEMQTSESECINRLAADETRPDKEAWSNVIHDYYEAKEARAMKIEIRTDGAHISGYVNVTEKKSRPVITPHGKVVEVIEPRAFADAIQRAQNITVTVDHNAAPIYASTSDGTLELREDNIGMHADVTVTDPTLIDLAKRGKIRGWSFGMYNVVDEVEARADDLPLRKVKAFDLDHVTLVVNKTPAYSATSVELRAEAEVEIETRSFETDVQIAETAPRFDNSAYRNRADALKS